MGLDTSPDRRRDLSRWNIAAALGLLAAAFLMDRLAPAREDEDEIPEPRVPVTRHWISITQRDYPLARIHEPTIADTADRPSV